MELCMGKDSTDVLEATTIPITSIVVGTRHRKNLGDVQSLADSIAAVGLLHPPVVTSEHHLIAGERRLAALRLLGWTDTPVTVVDLADILRGEHDENFVRLDFSPSEAVDIGRAVEDEVRTPVGRPSAETPETFRNIPKGDTRDKAAEYVGMSGRTLEKARRVVEAAEADPTLMPLVEKMDETGKVDGAYKALQKVERVAALQEADAFPDGLYRVLYADPPWEYAGVNLDYYGPAERHYQTMPLKDICALPVEELVVDDAVLFLWATSPLLPSALLVMESWGFAYKASFIWDKVRHNFGHYNSVRHELLLLGTHGSCQPDVPELVDSVVTLERSKRHSEKPPEFREMIDRLYPHGPRVELFARCEVLGWDRWGAEA
jgi:N6-adenosine-specific RNA methylase IME4